MLAKTHRLSRSEFMHYFQSGRKYHGQYLTIITAPASTHKVAVVVGKKVALGAVARNRYRRQLYGVIERTLPSSFQGAVIIITKPPFAKLTASERRVVATTALAQIVKVG